MSSLISDLDSAPAQGDGDFVANILSEMNGGGGGGPPPPMVQQAPPAMGGQRAMIDAPNPNSLGQRGMDSNPITAHMIGNSHPTPADFQQMMGSGGGGGGGGQPIPSPVPQGQFAGSAAAFQPGPQPTYLPPPAKKSWLTRAADELRTACFVAILVFIFSLPVVNFLFAHYIPSMVKSTGELTLIGLLVKSAAAGAAFWLLQRVVVPLLSL